MAIESPIARLCSIQASPSVCGFHRIRNRPRRELPVKGDCQLEMETDANRKQPAAAFKTLVCSVSDTAAAAPSSASAAFCCGLSSICEIAPVNALKARNAKAVSGVSFGFSPPVTAQSLLSPYLESHGMPD
jgi:hypothetical protein